MSFLKDDEFIIFMDTPTASGRVLSVSELRNVHQAGINTMLRVDTQWNKFIPRIGEARWSYFEDYLERADMAGMKAIIPLWNVQATYYPLDFYVRRAAGPVYGMFSPWNARAQTLNNQVLEMVRDRITSERCMVVLGQYGGERVLLNQPAYYDDYARTSWLQSGHTGEPDHRTPEGAQWLKEAYIKLLVDQQKIIVNSRHREIWYMLSRYKAGQSDISCHGCEWVDSYLDAFTALKPQSINHISYNYFPYGQSYWDLMKRDRAWGVNEFVGAEYCEGLRDGNGRIAVEQGLRGMVVGPVHPLTGHEKIETWMYHELEKANKLFQEREKVMA